MINLEEILVVNIAGAVLFLILPSMRMKGRGHLHFGDRLFNIMSWISFCALLLEIVSFLIDGLPGTAMRVLAYLSNGYLFLASAAVGMLWVLYVDYGIYRGSRRIRRRLITVALPFAVVAVSVAADMFGAGIIFSIGPDNVYTRGRFVLLSYAVMFLYYAYSIALSVYTAKKTGHTMFPAHYFVLPCVLGTLVQGARYGITVGWFSVSIAFALIQMQIQNFNSYVDDLSGLFNRRYYNYFIDKKVKSEKCGTLAGIMMDINHFKEINDRLGHMMGDNAIRDLAGILTKLTTERITAFRLSGDEFVILGEDFSEEDTRLLVDCFLREVAAFNEKGERPYTLSLAIGWIVCDTRTLDSDVFFNRMDEKMYDSKAVYYSQKNKDRRRADRD